LTGRFEGFDYVFFGRKLNVHAFPLFLEHLGRGTEKLFPS
jgi:hypothetical protein